MTTLRGTMLRPGPSGNKRLYTKENIASAYQRLSERLSDGDALPVTMLTHHAAGDDSTEIVGHLSTVTMNGDNLDYTAVLADTVPSKTIENLVKPGPDGKPSLKSVSIRGWWLGPVETVEHQGQQCTTAADLEIDGLDFTKNPGVTGATVAIADEVGTTESAGRTLITETVDARVQFTETLPEAAMSETQQAQQAQPVFADLGYQADKIKRFPVQDRPAAETSWARINRPDIAETYTGPQIKRIKGRIREALAKHGADMTKIAEQDKGTDIAEHEVKLTDVTECYGCYDDTGTAGFSISAYNGPLTVSVSAYSGILPEELAGIATAAMQAAIDAVHAMDPDDDGDIDTGTMHPEPEPGTESTTQPKEATVAETQAPAATTSEPAGKAETATETLTRADLDAAVEAAVTAALAARTGTTEGAPATAAGTEETVSATTPIDEAALRESLRADLIAEMRQNGTLGRKGLVEAAIKENGEPGKPLHEMSDEELRAHTAETMVPLILPNR